MKNSFRMKGGNIKKSTILALVILLFGLATIISGGKALFTDLGIQTRGNTVPLVLWFNFISGFIYILVGILTFNLKTHIKMLSAVLAVANILVLALLFLHIYQGGLYEMRTLIAMTFRTFFWIAMAIYFYKMQFITQSKLRT